MKLNLFKEIYPEKLRQEGYFLYGRELEYSRLRRLSERKISNNVLVVGERGIGKTNLAYGMVFNEKRKFLEVRKDLLADAVFSYQSDSTLLSSIKTQFEAQHNAIIFIDDLNILLADDLVFRQRLFSLLNSLFENFHISVIATINPAAHRMYFENNVELSKHFEILRLDELKEVILKEIIKRHIGRLATTYNITLDDSLAYHSLLLTNRYTKTALQPTRALDLLDEACVYAMDKKTKKVTIQHIRQVMAESTGIPIQEITVNDREKLQNLTVLLQSNIKGQEYAIKRVTKVIRRARTGVNDPRRPLGSFLFLGPSGTGKTYFAKSLAKIMYNDESAFVRLDMSEFTEGHNVQRLVGAPPGYVGYEEGGQLTNPIWERPYSLILLDEIEKAHPRVFDLFLQVIDEGRLTDGRGRTINFNHTIIIATSNIGVEYLIKRYQKRKEDETEDMFVEGMMPLLLSYFRPEFINRFDELILFKPLDRLDLHAIARNEISKLNERLRDRGIEVRINDEVLQKMVFKDFDPQFGARPLMRLLREQIEDEVARRIVFEGLGQGGVIEIS